MVEDIQSGQALYDGQTPSEITRMKIGLILECGPEGADKKVCELVLSRLVPDLEIVTITLDNKPTLGEQCAASAAQLFSEGCERIVKSGSDSVVR